MTAKATGGNFEERPDVAEYIPMREVCRRLGIARSTVYRHDLFRYAIQVGSQWRFRWADVVKHYETQRKTAGNGNPSTDSARAPQDSP